MHELSLANDIVEIATEAARRAGAVRVESVHLRIGRLAGVEADALRFCFDLAAAGTVLAGAQLRVEDVPPVIWCGPCGCERELPGVHPIHCPICGAPGGELRHGREFEVHALEITEVMA